jgi:hypothetical protein
MSFSVSEIFDFHASNGITNHPPDAPGLIHVSGLRDRPLGHACDGTDEAIVGCPIAG